jgi:hypothetical protein
VSREPAARVRVGDDGGIEVSLPEQGTQTLSPAPDLIPAENKNINENLHRDWYSERGTSDRDWPSHWSQTKLFSDAPPSLRTLRRPKYKSDSPRLGTSPLL